MKSMMKILTRYVLSAAGITLVLLVLNFIVIVAWGFESGKFNQKDYNVSQIAAGLTEKDGVYTLSETAEKAIVQDYQWAMFLNDNGDVVWSENLPAEIPQSYTVSDVASFSRWYLKDYPVLCWQCDSGLFVLGEAKGSVWKYSIETAQAEMDHLLILVPAVLIINAAAAVLLALLFGLRLFRSVKPLAKGIEEMAAKQPVELATNGLLGDLAAGINQTSAELTKQEAALNKRDNARTTWIVGVSHDIRTPLSLMMGYASQLENDAALPPEKREQAGIIRRQSERIKALVSDLNLASKLEYEMQALRHDDVAMAPLLRVVAADFINSGLGDRYEIDLIIADDAQNIFVNGDEELLRRAVANLIDNGIQHNPEGAAIKVTLQKGLGNCAISVADNGIGFTAAALADLNGPQRSMEMESHGLGLTIVRQIVKAHYGTAGFFNLSTGGCMVTLCLPVSSVNDH